ncbi:hypothetical protein IFT98_19795 [Pseudomonas sp. CFBP 8770]|uniref:hypothetical protein n=1 Tax=unclassified Pseudomonas TaxID=196821 RepID=UPI00177C93AF|nr:MULTISPECIES: hypothetical protein [unclassified Pseudomonas]MBD8476458.1 hypothetical protein [Pseudomonas sp. CFBP 8773]MBD8649240.1 hypothetical protein [Pseudomonas sp. CFBP 8770]
MSFPRIHGVKIDARTLSKHHWNADLIEFEGPLLSLYKGESGDDLLYAWLDCTEIRNRWCIIPVDRKSLREYLEQIKTLRDIYLESEWLVIFHTGVSSKRSAFMRTSWDKLPELYLPEADSYLTPEIATEAAEKLAEEITEAYFLGLDGEMYIDDFSIVPKIYQQLYSFHYGLEHLDRPAVQGALNRLAGSWTGGFSAVHLFTGLNSVTPSIHRAKVTEIHFASPGHIQLDLLPDLARRIEISAAQIADDASFVALEQYYSTVYRYFRENKLSGFDDERELKDSDLQPETLSRLEEFVTYFFALMKWNDYRGGFDFLNVDALHQLRVLLAYYRRLRKLRPYIIGGNLFLGQSQLDGNADIDDLD